MVGQVLIVRIDNICTYVYIGMYNCIKNLREDATEGTKAIF